MNTGLLVDQPRLWIASYVEAWDRFWFTPRLPHTLCALRIVTGAMLLYSHLVLATDLSSFLGDNAWVNNETAQQLHNGAFGFTDLGRTYLWHISNPLLLWMHHGLTMLVTAAFAVGFLTRITAPMAWFLQLMYLHRLTGTLFGLDQIVTYSAMYLMLSPCGSCFSVDAWLRNRMAGQRSQSKKLQWLLPEATSSIAANIATRIFQLHLCVIYLFGGLSKARGESWWDGTAMWYSVANYEYQSIDMTWIGRYPRVFTALTHVTLFWEVFYCLLVWPRLTRPIVLALAVAVHGGIALFLGMITFGVMMIAANMIFVAPETVRRLSRGGENDTQDAAGDAEGASVASTIADPLEATADAESPLIDQAAGTVDENEQAAEDVGVASEDLDDEDEFDEISLEELGLEELSQDSNASGILQRSLNHDSSASGILDNMAAREASLARREQRLRDASKTLKEKRARLNDKLDKFNDRVARLKERESKLKRAVERKRSSKNRDTPGGASEDNKPNEQAS